MNQTFNKNLAKELRTLPREWRTQMFYEVVPEKVQVEIYIEITGVDLRADLQFSPDAWEELIIDNENGAEAIVNLIRAAIQSDLDDPSFREEFGIE